MYCPYCGEANEDGYIFCGKCGSELPTQPGQVQGVPTPSPFDPPQTRGPARISVTAIVAGVLVLAFVIMLGWIIFGKKDKPGPAQEAAITQESAVFDGSAGSQENEGTQERAPLAGQENIPQQPTAGGFIAGKTTVPAGPASGVWELALLSSEQIPDYGGKLPAEGHVFHRLELLAVNTGDTLASSSIGSFTAEWQGNTYPQMDVKQLQGNIPPGWPLKIEVVFDLPAIAQKPAFKLQVLALNASERYVVNLNELDSQLKYEPVQLTSFDKTFEIPGRMSIKPTGIRRLRGGEGNSLMEYLVLDASVSNLGGYDLNMPGEARKAGLSFQVFIPGNIYPDSRNYSWAYPAPGTMQDVITNGYYFNPAPVPPGYTHDGAFLLHPVGYKELLAAPGQSFYDGGLLLVQMFNDWALYPLDDTSSALLKAPLAPIDPLQAALAQAQAAVQEGSWVKAGSLYGALAKAHPGNQEYLRQLAEIQAHTGRWVFATTYYDQSTSHDRLKTFARSLWGADAAGFVLHDLPVPAMEGNPINQPIYSPDGATSVTLTQGETGFQASITDLGGSGASVSASLPVDNSRSEWLDGNVYTWSNDGRYLLLPFIAAETRGLSVLLLDRVEGSALRYDTCAVPNGVYAIAWSPDGASVAYADQSTSQIGIASLAGGECRSFPMGVEYVGYVSNLVWSPGNQVYVILENVLNVFSPDGSILKTEALDAYNSRLFLSPDGRYLAYSKGWENNVVYDLQSGERTAFEPSQGALIGWIP